jgi:hypothetical protein
MGQMSKIESVAQASLGLGIIRNDTQDSVFLQARG